MRLIVLALFYFHLNTLLFSQQALEGEPSPDKYLLDLNIPSGWTIKRNIEGSDYTLTASSPGDEFFLYYVQFMEDDKKQPKRYLHTYATQFGIEAKLETTTKKINNNKQKFYFVNGEGEIMGEKNKVFIWATTADNKNIAAYLIYPANTGPEVDKEVRAIMLGE